MRRFRTNVFTWEPLSAANQNPLQNLDGLWWYYLDNPWSTINVYQLGEIYVTSWRVVFLKNLSESDWAKQDFFANICLYKKVRDLFFCYVAWQILPVILIIIQNTPKAVVQRCSVKKVFLESSQNSLENTCAGVSFLIKLQASWLQLH